MRLLAILALLLCALTLFGCIAPIVSKEQTTQSATVTDPAETSAAPTVSETLPPPEPEFFPNEGDDEQSKRY